MERAFQVNLSATAPDRLQQFLSVHHLGVKALAVHDLAMLRIVDRWWPMETDSGPMTLNEFRRRHNVIRYTASADEFRELSAVANAQGIGLVNGGYVYVIDIMRRLPQLDPAVRVSRLDPSELATTFLPPDPATLARLGPFLSAADAALCPLRCEVLLRGFDPPGLPALYLLSRAAMRAEEVRAAKESANDLWSDVLSAFGGEPDPARPRLVLNLRSPVVRRLTELPEAELIRLAVQALYGQAMLRRWSWSGRCCWARSGSMSRPWRWTAWHCCRWSAPATPTWPRGPTGARPAGCTRASIRWNTTERCSSSARSPATRTPAPSGCTRSRSSASASGRSRTWSTPRPSPSSPASLSELDAATPCSTSATIRTAVHLGHSGAGCAATRWPLPTASTPATVVQRRATGSVFDLTRCRWPTSSRSLPAASNGSESCHRLDCPTCSCWIGPRRTTTAANRRRPAPASPPSRTIFQTRWKHGEPSCTRCST